MSPPAVLSKSAFLLGLTCSRKVAYHARGYPTAAGESEFLEMLADGGAVIGAAARLAFPAGVMVGTLDREAALRRTTDLLREERVTIFEAAIGHGRCFCRCDLLIKDENRFQLIEVKSKALPRDEVDGAFLLTKSGGVRSEWRKIIHDIGFQRMILARAFPEADITCFLLGPGQDVVADRDGLPALFEIDAMGGMESVRFTGSVEEEQAVGRLFERVRVDAAVAAVAGEVEAHAGRLATLYQADGSVSMPFVKLGYHCKSCEFRMPDGHAGPEGFRECWGALADPSPHLFDLHNLYRLRNGALADAKIAEGRTALADLTLAEILETSRRAGNPESARDPILERQLIQLRHQTAGTQWVSDSLAGAMAGMPRPLHFIDFETCTPTLPEYRGMRPNETVAFQWSCHTLDDRAGTPGTLQHCEWLHDPTAQPGCPNLEFARTLLAAVEAGGAVLTWTGHEAGVLAQIAKSIRERSPGEWVLADRIEVLIDRLVDQCEMCRVHYFHPAMGGSNSLKAVLPAVWGASAELRENPWFAAFLQDEDASPVDPYKLLPPMEVDGEGTTVREGTGAIRAYQAILHGAAQDRPAWRSLLLQYCHLDTLAMVIVWEYWERRAKLGIEVGTEH